MGYLDTARSVLTETSGDPEAAITFAALTTSLERVDEALGNLMKEWGYSSLVEDE